MDIRLFITDLDGTLFGDNGDVSEANYRAMERMTELGCRVAISTGRTLGQIPVRLREHPSVDYIIYSNGAMIRDLRDGSDGGTLIEGDLARRVADILDKYGCYAVIHKDGTCLVDRDSTEGETLSRVDMPPNYRALFFKYAARVDRLTDIIRGGGLEMICVFFRSAEDSEACARELGELRGVGFTSSTGTSWEIYAEGAGKGSAVRTLLDKLGLTPQQTVIAGDSRNDITMLAIGGNTVAMANGHPDVKAIASEIGCHCNDGIADYVVRKYLLGK